MADYRQIFDAISVDPRYLSNLDWGDPRPGHPEGTVRAHIAELERNLETIRSKVSDTEFWKLKILSHIHDTFKGEAEQGVPIMHPHSHASLARAFLASYCDDSDLLAMIQFHDEPFALWQQFESKGKFSTERWDALIKGISNWNLFLAFNIVDGCTEGKSRQPLHWLFRQTAGKVASRFTESDIL